MERTLSPMPREVANFPGGGAQSKGVPLGQARTSLTGVRCPTGERKVANNTVPYVNAAPVATKRANLANMLWISALFIRSAMNANY